MENVAESAMKRTRFQEGPQVREAISRFCLRTKANVSKANVSIYEIKIRAI
jgi:hypothetical protein